MTNNKSFQATSLICCALISFSTAKAQSLKEEPKRSGALTDWFLHDWSIKDPKKPFYTSPTHLQVRILATAGHRAGKGGEQSVIKIVDKGREVYCSDDDKDTKASLCFGEPVYVGSIDGGKIAIVSFGPSPYYYIVVFTYTGGKVRAVLNTGSKLYPEIVYPAHSPKINVSQNGNKTLQSHFPNLEPRIITTNVVEKCENGEIPISAYVHVWDPTTNKYKSSICVPWDKRLEVIR